MNLLKVDNIHVGVKDNFILEGLSFEINESDSIFISGDSGSGKTTLLKAIQNNISLYSGKIHYNLNLGDICLVSQTNLVKSKSNLVDSFYQQRFNSSYSSDAMTVKEYLDNDEDLRLPELLRSLEIDNLYNCSLLKLSNGQHKRLQLIKAILSNPKILLLDAPFTGIDQKSKKLIGKIISDLKICVVATGEGTKELLTFNKEISLKKKTTNLDEVNLDLKYNCKTNYEIAFQLENLIVGYRDKVVLSGISWTVRKGERWLLRGPNGVGKTTLLSVLNGDHPQAYKNKISLFDRKRGTGESIWDIKSKIGFFSPEVHAYFDQNATVFYTIAGGIFDSIGVSQKLSEDNNLLIKDWMEKLNLWGLKDSLLILLPRGIQRLVLLVRVLIKQAGLIILDEPCQGLDPRQTRLILDLVDQICMNKDVTLIYVSHELNDIPKSVNQYFDL